MTTSRTGAVGAEAVGTFALVFTGCGAIMVDASWPNTLGHVGVCAVFGLVIAVMIYATGHLSGAHFNPAVTLAFASIGAFSWRRVPEYVLAQCGGALLAAGLLRALLGNAASLGATSPSVGLTEAVVIEVILTFFLMFVITSVAMDGRAVGAMAGFAIGGTVAIGALMGGPLTGASLNPARSLGPALVSLNLEFLWVYFLGPLVGALAGAWAYQLIRGRRAALSQAEGNALETD